jgi:hypothetical protein
MKYLKKEGRNKGREGGLRDRDEGHEVRDQRRRWRENKEDNGASASFLT